MPTFARADVQIYYETHGDGFPLLTFAPGGMRSCIGAWQRAVYDPIATLSKDFRVVAMDQRNAGLSHAPVRPGDGWHVYTEDHLALLEHLEIDRFAVLGQCIGCSFCLGLMQASPQRVVAAVLQQPIGADGDNRAAFHQLFDSWAYDLRQEAPDLDPNTLAGIRDRMYERDFVFNVSSAFVERCEIPMLVLMGDDLYHPSDVSRQLAELAPRGELIESWKDPASVDATVAVVRRFLVEHTASA